MKCGNCKNIRDGWCDILYDSPDLDIERECVSYKVMTNYDRIKQMSIDEVATMLDSFCLDCSYCPACDFCNESFKDKKCRDIVKQWLEQEVEEHDR